jgi:hypothetical protein
MSTRKQEAQGLVLRTTAGARNRATQLGEATRQAALKRLHHAIAAQNAWLNPWTLQIAERESALQDSEVASIKENEALESFENALEACLQALANDHATPETTETPEVKTTKVVLNKCWGGFGLSDRAKEALAVSLKAEITEELAFEIAKSTAWRSRPELIKVIESLGEDANGPYAKLMIVEIPANVAWYIRDNDGAETACEPHRTW